MFIDPDVLYGIDPQGEGLYVAVLGDRPEAHHILRRHGFEPRTLRGLPLYQLPTDLPAEARDQLVRESCQALLEHGYLVVNTQNVTALTPQTPEIGKADTGPLEQQASAPALPGEQAAHAPPSLPQAPQTPSFTSRLHHPPRPR
ncbi:hypothetical protein [Streptomyces sp. YIM 98790]|uniref:hypothetical protein n=1 Tax=Streptomyces sp. YIM 98790 TaxID=2689077 RepID=UPI001409FEB6|nr:hypothetical protein [Streptomyces sp. YIM 98790]